MKNLFRSGITLALLSGRVFVVWAGADDWPQWRGPNRDAVSSETGLLKQWPSGGPPLVWKATGLGLGYSTVAVAGDRIFTIGDKGDSSLVLALSRADGQSLWSTPLGKAGTPGWGGFEGPRSTPTVAHELVFAVGQWGELVCLEASSGKELWRKDYEKDFGGPRPEWGFAESPLVDGDHVVVTPGGSQGAIGALDTKHGKTIWRSKGF